MPRPTPEAVAEKAAQLRRFRRLALRTLLRSAGIGGVIGAFVGLRIRRSSPTVPTVVALGAGFLAGALLVCLLTGPTWVVAYRKLARGDIGRVRAGRMRRSG